MEIIVCYEFRNYMTWFVASYFRAWKLSEYRDFSGPYFPAFRLNTEIYFVNQCIQSESRKIRTRKKLRFWTLFMQYLTKWFHAGNYFYPSAYSKISKAKMLNINILLPPDTQIYVCISGGYRMLMFKSFAFRNFWMTPKKNKYA